MTSGTQAVDSNGIPGGHAGEVPLRYATAEKANETASKKANDDA